MLSGRERVVSLTQIKRAAAKRARQYGFGTPLRLAVAGVVGTQNAFRALMEAAQQYLEAGRRYLEAAGQRSLDLLKVAHLVKVGPLIIGSARGLNVLGKAVSLDTTSEGGKLSHYGFFGIACACDIH